MRLRAADKLTLCWTVGWWSLYTVERGMWRVGLFLSRCVLPEGREVNEDTSSDHFISFLFNLFVIDAMLTDDRMFSSEVEHESVKE